jgi:hypothetical protein
MATPERTPIEFYYPGTPVEFGGTLGCATKGVVIGVIFRVTGLMYEIAFLDDGEMKEIVIHGFLVAACEPLQRLGFASALGKSIE